MRQNCLRDVEGETADENGEEGCPGEVLDDAGEEGFAFAAEAEEGE